MWGARAWLQILTRGGLHAAHLCWWCWGVEHFAATASYWLVRCHAQRLTVCVAAPAGYLEALEQALSRFPEARATCPRVELGGSGWAAALGQQLRACARIVVVAAPVAAVMDAYGLSGPDGLEELRQLEQAMEHLVRNGSTVLCAYDAAVLSEAEEPAARAVVELALRQHPRALLTP